MTRCGVLRLNVKLSEPPIKEIYEVHSLDEGHHRGRSRGVQHMPLTIGGQGLDEAKSSTYQAIRNRIRDESGGKRGSMWLISSIAARSYGRNEIHTGYPNNPGGLPELNLPTLCSLINPCATWTTGLNARLTLSLFLVRRIRQPNGGWSDDRRGLCCYSFTGVP